MLCSSATANQARVCVCFADESANGWNEPQQFQQRDGLWPAPQHSRRMDWKLLWPDSQHTTVEMKVAIEIFPRTAT